MTSIKIPLLLILLLCIAVPVFGADTVHTYDTVVHYDTTYLYDTTGAVQKQLNEMKSEFYDRAMQSIDDKRSSVNIMLTIIAIFLGIMTIVFAFMTYLMQRSRQAVDNEIREIRERRLAIDRVYDEIVSKEKRINKLMSKVEENAERPVAAAEKEAQEKSITSPEEKIKLIEKADAEESIDEYEKLLFAMELEGVSKDKLPTSLRKNVGINYIALARYERAIEEFSLYLKAVPNDHEGLFDVAYSYGMLNDHEKAAEFFGRAAKADPSDDMAYYNWGTSLSKLYDERKDDSLLDEAIEKFKRAVEIDDQNDDTYTNWGATLSKLYNERKDVSLLEEASEKFKRAVEINDKDDSAYFNWGAGLVMLYNERKDVSLLEEASAKYNKAVEINDKNHETWCNLSNVLAKQWRLTHDETLLKDAKGMALKAIKLVPEDSFAHYNLACAESLLNNKPDMLKALKLAIEYDPKLKKTAREDKDKNFEKYWSDPDFVALTKED